LAVLPLASVRHVCVYYYWALANPRLYLACLLLICINSLMICLWIQLYVDIVVTGKVMDGYLQLLSIYDELLGLWLVFASSG
jgi:hypothetical protein